MSAQPMVAPITATLTSAITSVFGNPVVHYGIPDEWNADVFCYFYHDGSYDIPKAGPSLIRRWHVWPIVVMVRKGSPDTTEDLMLSLSDVITDAFYTNRRLSGAATDLNVYQRDGKVRTNTVYTVIGNDFYRHRIFTIEAAEDKVFSFH